MKKNRKPPFRLLFIGSLAVSGEERFLPALNGALRGGVDAFLLREKEMDGGPLLRLARECMEATGRARASLLVSDRPDVAMAAGARGVHLPENSFTPREARSVSGDALLIGRSVHDLRGAQTAEEENADYLLLGPLFPTPGKERFALGLDEASAIREGVSIPVIAVGGIDARNAGRVRAAGFESIAFIRVVAGAVDPAAAAEAVRLAFGEPE